MMGLVDERGALDFYHGGLRARDADGGPDLRPRRLRDLQDPAPGRREKLELYEIPAHQDARRRQRLVSRRAAGAGADLRPAADAARRSANGRRFSTSTAASRAWRADVSLGAHDRDAARGRMARELLDDPDIVGTRSDGGQGRPRREEAVGVIEAPRGTLFHHYRVDENDLVTYCNLIVSTTNNNQAMNEAIRAVASQLSVGPRADRGASEPYRGRHPRLRSRASPARPTRSARCRSRSTSSTPTARWSAGAGRIWRADAQRPTTMPLSLRSPP